MNENTLANILMKQIPEMTISGVYKGLGSVVGILSDYVENPAKNVAFDVATAGTAKGFKLAAPFMMGSIKGMKPITNNEFLSLFRGLRNMSSKRSLGKTVKGENIVGGGRSVPRIAKRRQHEDIIYTSLFPKTAESYATNQIGYSKNKIGTLLQFDVPWDHIGKVNEGAVSELADLYSKNVIGDRRLAIWEKEILARKGGFLQQVGMDYKYPEFEILEELSMQAKNNPLLDLPTKGIYTFKEGIPTKYLSDIKFIPRIQDKALERQLNRPERIENILDYLKSLKR